VLARGTGESELRNGVRGFGLQHNGVRIHPIESGHNDTKGPGAVDVLLNSLLAMFSCQKHRLLFLLGVGGCGRSRAPAAGIGICVIVGTGDFLLQVAAAGEVGQSEIELGIGDLSVQVARTIVFVLGVVVPEQDFQTRGIVSHRRGVIPIDALKITFPQVDLRQVAVCMLILMLMLMLVLVLVLVLVLMLVLVLVIVCCVRFSLGGMN